MFKSTSAQGEHGGEVELGTSPSWRYVFLLSTGNRDDDAESGPFRSRASTHSASLHLARGFLFFFFADALRGRPSRAKRAVGRSIEGWEDASGLEIILSVDSPRFIASTPRRCARRGRRDRRRDLLQLGSPAPAPARAEDDDEPGFSHRCPRRRRRRRRGRATTRASASNDE